MATMLRAASATKFRGYPPQEHGKGGMGDRAVSLPSLTPNGTRGVTGHGAGISDKFVTTKKTPSELLLERKEFGAAGFAKPTITGFLDVSQYSNYVGSAVSVDQPLFSVHPPMISFSNFEALHSYEATLTLRNQDSVARRVKVYPPNSPFFHVMPGRVKTSSRGRSAGNSSAGEKVAPGMEISFTIRFKPDARVDYNVDLVVMTEREQFSVPIRASGGSALLDFPDIVDFSSACIVGHESQRTVFVRNVGDRGTKFFLRTSPPFAVAQSHGYLDKGASAQIDLSFRPERAEDYEGELHLRYGDREAVATLMGSANNAAVSLSDSLLVIEDTYVGLETHGVVVIRNNSDVPVDFSWRLFPSVDEENDYRIRLRGQLKSEERVELLYMQQGLLSDDSSEGSSSDEERLKVRREKKVHDSLGRRYGSIAKAVTEDPLLFYDETFSIEPLVGRVWSHSQIECACSFHPRGALVYKCTAYLSCVGREMRAPLVLKGLGIGPKVSFSYDELDVSNVFVESAHRYEVQLLNRGDIEVDFRLVPKETKFGSWFHFEPSHGRIEVGGQCTIFVHFKPKELGPFNEVFEWVLKGSAIGVTLTFKGTSVRPTFSFDVDRINFGTVSYGFLNSRMLSLENTSEVPMRYTLRILGDEEPPHNEFDIVPAGGTLLPKCTQRVQLDFVSSQEKRYEMSMVVDLEGVDKELHSIPVTAVCMSPQVTFEPHGCLSYGDIFIRYPFHQSLYLHNTSNLPAKFEVMPQEDKSRAEFEPDQWTGSVPPCATHVITVTLTAHMPGPVRVPMYVRILGRSVPFPLVLVANSIGPRVMVEPAMLDWSSVKCLEPVVRHVRLTNNSCIDASVRAFMNERKSLWTVHPKIIHLSPQETLQLAVTLKIDEATPAQDVLNLVVQESSPLTVQVRGRGIDTPVVSEEPLDHVDFGTLFTTHTGPREIVIRNYGQMARRIVWVREKEKTDKKKEAAEVKEKSERPPPVFRVEPENVIMEPKTAYRFTFLATSPVAGVVEETLVCNETLEKSGSLGKQIFRPRLTASFVAPQLLLSASELTFKFFWEKHKPIAHMQEPLKLENTGPLEVAFRVHVPQPFTVDVEEGCIPPHGSQEIIVDFYPGFKNDRKSGVEKRKLTVQYDDHPAVNTVDCIGKVVWPNLELESKLVDFGILLNETSKSMEVKMVNPTSLTVAYQWCLSTWPGRGDHSNPKTPLRSSPPDSQTSGWGRAHTTVGLGLGASGSWAVGNLAITEEASPTSGGSTGATSLGQPETGALAPSSAAAQPLVTAPFGMTHDSLATPEIDVNQIFDILPIFGTIGPGETQTATFTYYGLRDRSFKTTAVCVVDGGPEYEITLKGSAAPCRYYLDKTELDFADIPFTELGEQFLTLSNPGKVPIPYSFNNTGMSKPNVVDIVPPAGVMNAGERLKVAVRFRAGIPDEVCETMLLEVAHFEPTRLTVRGNGTFPGIVICLPRQNPEEHQAQLEEARKRMHTRGATGVLQLPGPAPGTADATGGAVPAASERRPSSSSAVGAAAQAAAAPAAPAPAADAEAAGSVKEAAAELTPRSAAASEGATSGAMRRVAHAHKPTQEDLDLELEVDRYYLCEVLLQAPPPQPTKSTAERRASALQRSQLTTMRTTQLSNRGVSAARKKEPPQVTAAHYTCDFGNISMGQIGKKQINVCNCTYEPVTVTIDKRLLRDNGFVLEPENISKLPPRQMMHMTLIATRNREEEGLSEIEWNLPVKGGPNYRIQVMANFVLPDFVLSSDQVDFGRVLVGQRKRIAIELRNDKAVPAEWAYLEPRDRYQRRLSPNEVTFDLVPSSGVLHPGERKIVYASFSPKVAQQASSSLQIRIRDNPRQKIINVFGRGEVLKVEVTGNIFELGPVMPNQGCTCEFTLLNPTDYPIEVYSLDFDKQYLDEEQLLAEFDGYEGGFAEMPVRKPGDPPWEPVARRVAELRKERDAEAGEGSAADGEGAESAAEAEEAKMPVTAPPTRPPSQAQPQAQGIEEPDAGAAEDAEGASAGSATEEAPAEPPLPAPTVVEIVSPPVEREPREPIANFTILTPPPPRPPTPEEGAEEEEPPAPPQPPPKMSKAQQKQWEQEQLRLQQQREQEAEEEARRLAEPSSDKTRWVIEPQSEQKLLIHFTTLEVSRCGAALSFAILGDIVGEPVSITCSGVSALPGIATDPRILFPGAGKRKKRRPAGGYAVKAFVLEDQIYDFGPLLAGRDPASRHPVPLTSPEEPKDSSSATSAEVGKAASSSGSAADGEELQLQPVSAHVLRHSESVRIANDSLFPANIRFSLESLMPSSSESADGAPAPTPAATDPEVAPALPFIIEPENLLLGVGEQADVKVWCFPTEKGVIDDRLVANIEHNPTPVSFGLCAVGAVPWATLDQEKVDFGRLLMNMRAEDQRICLRNESALPVRWQLLCRKAKVLDAGQMEAEAAAAAAAAKAKGKAKGKAAASKRTPSKSPVPKEEPDEDEDDDPEARVPEEFSIDAFEGTLQAGAEQYVRVGFRAARPASFRCILGLEVRDDQGFRDWQRAGRLEVQAETFAVSVTVEPDPREKPLDFGTVLVGSSAQRTFEVVNNGRYPVRYQLSIKGGLLRSILGIDAPDGDLPPEGQNGHRRTITVTCTPGRQLDLPSDRDGIVLQVFDVFNEKTSAEPVADLRVPPLRVGLTAVYNSFQITPPRNLNFGPVERGQKKPGSFVFRNIGIFPFEWCLFDPTAPPVYGANQLPVMPPAEIAVGPFTIKPTSGRLGQDEEIPITVDFDASGDEEFTSRIAFWVDGVQGDSVADLGDRTRRNAGFMATAAQEGAPVVATSTYVLTGQSCIPGINCNDLQSVFEEQFFARTLEDAIAIAGRPDVRAFCEVDRIFHFGPVLAYGGSSQAESLPPSPMSSSVRGAQGEELNASQGVIERFRLTNPKAIPCRVRIEVRGRGEEDAPPAGGGKQLKGKAPPPPKESVFKVRAEDQEIVIPARDSQQIEVCFQPPRLASFSAEFKATVVGGMDPLTNSLSFELRGDGAVPSVSLQGPPIWESGRGGALHLGKLPLERAHEVRMALRNDGLLPATVYVDAKDSPHFEVVCPARLHLGRGASQAFPIRYMPQGVGEHESALNVRTQGNPYENVQIQLSGEGYRDDVAWDLSEVKLPNWSGREADDTAAAPSSEALPPAPDQLELGEVAVGSQAEVVFKLVNNNARPLRFELPEQMPEPFGAEQLTVQPRIGFVEPGTKQAITVTFKPEAQLQANKVMVPCNVVEVDLPEEEAAEAPAAEGTDGEEVPPRLPERAAVEVEETRRDVPLYISATTDTHALKQTVSDGKPRGERAELTEIRFKSTVMFDVKVYRFVVENEAAISAPCEFTVRGKNSAAFTVSPAFCLVPPKGEREVEVRFAPLEVENFDCSLVRTIAAGTSEPEALEALQAAVPLTGTALRPWCHIDVPPSDYRSRRQSDKPLDPKYKIIEIKSLGTHVKNTRRFYVYNPTSETIDFEWAHMRGAPADALRPGDGGSGDDESFRCLTKRGKILPDKKFEMVFEFAPLTIETRESFWLFVLLGPKVEEHFLIVGTVEEPCIGMNRPAINFGERLLDGTGVEKVSLVNKEIIPFSFAFDTMSFQLEGQPQVLAINPVSGVVGPDTAVDIEVVFKPQQERSFNFNVVCNVKRKKEPIVLNVKGIGYKIHASLTVDEISTGRRVLNAGVLEMLDFGVLQVQERRTYSLFLKNDSKRDFNFRAMLQAGPGRKGKPITSSDKPPYLSLSRLEDVAQRQAETEIELTYAPRDVHNLDGVVLQILIPTGTSEQSFAVALSGGAKRARLDFSFASHDFGPCFIARAGATMAGQPLPSSEDSSFERANLVVSNREDSDIMLSTNFLREPWLDLQLDDTNIEPGNSVVIPIIFSPGEAKEYAKRLEFIVGEYSRSFVDIRGRGCPLRLELVDIQMQNVDFGVTTGGGTVTRTVRVMNRSARAVTFQLRDEKNQLSERGVTWVPAHMTTLRPRETLDITLRFAPMYKISAFRFPLIADCTQGGEVRLLQVSGTCHATEVRLSEHSVFFGDVVTGSQSSKIVHLRNFGDLGAKFRFDMPARYQGVYSISPMDGFVRPQEEVPLTLVFHPTLDRVQQFRSAGNRKRAAAEAKEVSITVRDLRCILDGHPPLTLEASGTCVDRPGEADKLEFVTPVRMRVENSFNVLNSSDTDWKLKPQVTTTEPAGATYWTGPNEVAVPAGKEVQVTIAYMPLMMTEPAEGTTLDASTQRLRPRADKHRGTVFIGTPNGQAFLYNLEGTALPPKSNDPLVVEVPCKRQYTQRVPVKNWLQERQRFEAEVELLDPLPDSREAQGFTLQAVGTLDLPAGLERDYKFNIYAYREGTAKVRVCLTSRETKEFIESQVMFKFVAPESLATLELEAACRQLARHKITVANPLDQVATFTSTSSYPHLRFSADPFEVQPGKERTVDLLFRPLVEGSDQATVTLKSDELGLYPYTVNWRATPAGRDKTVVLKAPLGGWVVETFKFINFSTDPTVYKARVEPLASHPQAGGDFKVELPPPQELRPPPADPNEGSEVSLGVRFQPSSLGESRALLVVSGEKAGEYKALLTGFAQPPQPQGPITILNGKSGQIDFRNPFTSVTNFKLQTDNPCFLIQQKERRLDPHQNVMIDVTFKADTTPFKAQGGRLIISTANISTPWIYFLKGEQ